MPTSELANASKGIVVGVDVDQSALDKLNRKIESNGLSYRVKTRRYSMFELSFPDESFEIIWVEGSIQAIGFEVGLMKWRRLLVPHGFLVIHDEIKALSRVLWSIPSCGYSLTRKFSLPAYAWWTDYYEPLEHRVKALYEKCTGNAEAIKTLGKVQKEIVMVKGNPKECRSAFYILQKR